MELSLSKLPWHWQVGAFVAVSAVALVGFHWYYRAPQLDIMAQRQQEFERLTADINRALATANQLPKFEAEVAELETRLESLRAVLPEQKDAADLLRRIQTLATQSNLTIRGFTPQPAQTRDLHEEWPIRLQLEGTYHSLGAFFDKISKFPRIINVTSVTIRVKQPPEVNVTITADCTATTFVLLQSPPIAAGEPAESPVGN